MMPTKKKTEKPKAAETVAVVEEKKQTEADKLLNEAHLLVDFGMVTNHAKFFRNDC